VEDGMDELIVSSNAFWWWYSSYDVLSPILVFTHLTFFIIIIADHDSPLQLADIDAPISVPFESPS
jgi:hypothetical protein